MIVAVVRMTAALQRARRIGPALDAHYRLILWLVPTLAGFPRSRNFLLRIVVSMNTDYVSNRKVIST